MGLIDSKTRVIDARLTDIGRAQIANGGLKVQYVSFSDIGSSYEDAGGGVAAEPVGVGFESFSTPSDQITVSTNDSGQLIANSVGNYVLGNNGTVRQNASAAASLISADDFLSTNLLESFKNQRIIGSRNVVLNDAGFTITQATCSFKLNSETFGNNPSVAYSNDVESFFQDKRLAQSVNFMYLPPVQRLGSRSVTGSLGNYPNFAETYETSPDEIESSLSIMQSSEIEFDKFASKGQIAMQMFDISGSTMSKLDIIDYGNLPTLTEDGRNRRLYFVGKVILDSNQVPTFINIFDIVVRS